MCHAPSVTANPRTWGGEVPHRPTHGKTCAISSKPFEAWSFKRLVRRQRGAQNGHSCLHRTPPVEVCA